MPEEQLAGFASTKPAVERLKQVTESGEGSEHDDTVRINQQLDRQVKEHVELAKELNEVPIRGKGRVRGRVWVGVRVKELNEMRRACAPICTRGGSRSCPLNHVPVTMANDNDKKR